MNNILLFSDHIHLKQIVTLTYLFIYFASSCLKHHVFIFRSSTSGPGLYSHAADTENLALEYIVHVLYDSCSVNLPNKDFVWCHPCIVERYEIVKMTSKMVERQNILLFDHLRAYYYLFLLKKQGCGVTELKLLMRHLLYALPPFAVMFSYLS